MIYHPDLGIIKQIERKVGKKLPNIGFSGVLYENGYDMDERGVVQLNLRKLYISNLDLVGKLRNLIILYLDVNKITDLSPLKGLTNLSILSLDVNQISDISPLRWLSNLTKINLFANQITDISPLSELKWLEDLELGQNPIKHIPSWAKQRGVRITFYRG